MSENPKIKRRGGPTPKGPSPYPPLQPYIDWLNRNGEFATLGLLADRMAQMPGLAKFSNKQLAGMNTGRFPVRERHIEALHRAFRLDRYIESYRSLWAWPSTGTVKGFEPRPLESFMSMVEEAIRDAPGIVEFARQNSTDTPVTLRLIRSANAALGHNGTSILPPLAGNFRVGDAVYLTCAVPGRGYLDLITSIYANDQPNIRRFMHLNPLLGLNGPVDREFNSPLIPVGGPAERRYQLLAFYWPTSLGRPPRTFRNSTSRSGSEEGFGVAELEPAIRMALDKRSEFSSGSDRPEISIVDYFVDR